MTHPIDRLDRHLLDIMPGSAQQQLRVCPLERIGASRESVERWVDEAAGPLLSRMSQTSLGRDRDGTPIAHDDLEEAGRCGLLAASLPREIGGLGLGSQSWGRVLQCVGEVCEDGSFALLLSLFPAVAGMIYASGRSDLIARYAQPCSTGERLVSFAFTEDNDAFSFSSTLRAKGEDFILDGRKTMVTGGAIAHAYMTYVVNQATGDLAVVLVDRDAPGVEVHPIDTMGLRGAGLAALHFNGVRVEKAQVMVEHNGLDHVQMFLNPRRATLCCAPVGRMRRIIADTVRHLSTTVRYGRPLTSMQSVQGRIGKMRMALNVSQMLLDRSLLELELNEGSAVPIFDANISTTKHQITEHAIALAIDALHLWGSNGYARTTPIERYLRDFCGLIPGAGAQDIIQVNLGLMTIGETKTETKIRTE